LGTLQDGFRYRFPPEIEKRGLAFAGQKIPLQRQDVRDRILKEINYLLMDRRSKVLHWLSRSDSLKPVMLPVIRKYQLPPETIYLAAIESSYNSRALSSAGAFGYWQFLKSTAAAGPQGADQYDWKMTMCHWKDERADLLSSTHSAAKYLAWMNKVMKVKIEGKEEKDGFGDWLLSAAAYNAGPRRVIERLNGFGADSYWDVPLPQETEKYVPRWIALTVISRYRDFYGVKPPRTDAFGFDTITKVRLKKDLTFAAMAQLLHTTPRTVWTLNTQIPPEKAVFPARHGSRTISHTIHVPHGTRTKFLAQLKAHGYTKE